MKEVRRDDKLENEQKRPRRKRQKPKVFERIMKAIEPKFACDDCSPRLCKSRDSGGNRIKATEATKQEGTSRKTTATASEGERIHQQSKRRKLAPEKKGSWDIKRQRQGEADNPGHESQETNSDDEEMPALVQEDSELDLAFDEIEEEESEDEFDDHNRKKAQAIIKASEQEMAKEAKEEGDPSYQPKQNSTPHAFYTPGSKRGRKPRTENSNKFRIISNNCSTMAPKRAEIEGWEADVIALQETRLGNIGQITTRAKLREQKWQAFFGKPMVNKATKSKVATATNAANGGVAILTKGGTPAKKAQNSAETAILRDQGRWEEVLRTLGKGNKHLKIASLYGYDGAATDGERFRLNEDLIGRALIRMLEGGDTPYLICGDFNITPQQSPAIASLIAKGLLIDVPHAFGLGGQHTFSHHGKSPPQEGVEGKGRTRIDTILANKAAFPLITDCKCRWDILLSDHVPIEVVMDIQRYGAEIKEPKLQPPFPEVKWTAKIEKKRGNKEMRNGQKHGAEAKEDSAKRKRNNTLKRCTDYGAKLQCKCSRQSPKLKD